MLSHDEFMSLFRHDALLASLMRNFILAVRIMKTHGVTPVSIPGLPETHTHDLWHVFDAALEDVICQWLPEVISEQNSAKTAAKWSDMYGKCRHLFQEYDKIFSTDNSIADGSAAPSRTFPEGLSAVFGRRSWLFSDILESIL